VAGEWWLWDTHLTSEKERDFFKLDAPFCFKCGRLGRILHQNTKVTMTGHHAFMAIPIEALYVVANQLGRLVFFSLSFKENAKKEVWHASLLPAAS